jgi:DNA-binding protein HU-beta
MRGLKTRVRAWLDRPEPAPCAPPNQTRRGAHSPSPPRAHAVTAARLELTAEGLGSAAASRALRGLANVYPPGGVQYPDASMRFDHRERALPLTQTQLVTAVAEHAELSKADAKRALTALEEIVLQELGNAQKVRIGGMVQLAVRVKPAQKKRQGRNPATGEEITIAAKPASVDLRARPLAKAKTALPSVQKARRRLAA